MAKKGRPAVDPLKNIAASGFIGYVEEEEEHSADEPGVIWVDIERIHNNPYQHAEDINPDDFAGLVASAHTKKRGTTSSMGEGTNVGMRHALPV